MPLRRPTQAPVTSIAVLQERIASLSRAIVLLEQAAPSTLQADGYTPLSEANDAGQGEVVINNEGAHIPADINSPVIYQHKGSLYSVSANANKFGWRPRGKVERGRAPGVPFTSTNIPFSTSFITPLAYYDWIESSYLGDITSDEPIMIDGNNKINIRYKGIYDIWGMFVINTFVSVAPKGTVYRFSIVPSPDIGAVYGSVSTPPVVNPDRSEAMTPFANSSSYVVRCGLHYKLVVSSDQPGWSILDFRGNYEAVPTSGLTENIYAHVAVAWRPLEARRI